MRPETIQQLNAMNTSFYRQQAASFARQREYYWPSWYRFARYSRVAEFLAPQVVDVGCGSGRFAQFWQEEVPVQVRYHGIDVSPELLNHAQLTLETLGWRAQLHERDIVKSVSSQENWLPSANALVTMFGVIHHIPSFLLRLQTIQHAVDSLDAGGELWLTLWNPLRVGTRVPHVTPAYRVAREYGLDAQDLEYGDVFLGWQNEPAVRYVHFVSAPEEHLLLNSVRHARVAHRWVENQRGERGNICVVLRKTAAV